MRSTHTTWTPGNDCVRHQSMRRNNDVEADSASPAGQWTRRRHLPLYQLLQLIVDERQLVQMQELLLSEGKLCRQ